MIPIFRPSMGDKEIAAVTEVLKSGWIGLGPKTEAFEKNFAEYVGVKYAVGVSSCTAALDLALKVNNIQDGEVILPALTFVSDGLAALYNNNKIVFADIDEETLCLDWQDVFKKITPKTKAIIPVHYGGRGDKIPETITTPVYPKDKLFEKQSIKIIEDCAHATGATGVGKNNTACWSFHAVKNLATGDGGMITTNDEEIYKKLLAMRWCGIDKSTWERSQKKYGWDYSIETIGYKYHMNDITASLGLVQLERLKELNNKRKLRVLEYLYELSSVQWMKLPKWDKNSSWHMFVARIEGRDTFIDYMLAHGVSIGVHYKPLNTYSIFPTADLPVTDRVWKTLVTLPLYPDMTNEEFDTIITLIKTYKS